VDKKFILEAVTALQKLGVRLSVQEVLEALGFSEADVDDVALGENVKPEPTGNPPGKAPALNAGPPSPAAFNALIATLAEDLQPLGEALAGALQAGDLPAMQAALRRISADMPSFLDSPLLEAALGDELVAAFTGEGVVANSGNAAGAVKGWETRRRNGWQSQPKSADQDVSHLVDDALDNTGDTSDQIAFFGDVGPEEARLLGLPPGYKRGLSRHAIRHFMASHGDPATEDTAGGRRCHPPSSRHSECTSRRRESPRDASWRSPRHIPRRCRRFWSGSGRGPPRPVRAFPPRRPSARV
jgi:hypothetical protein